MRLATVFCCTSLLLVVGALPATAIAESTKLTDQLPVPGVVNPAGPPNPAFPFEQDVPFRVASDNQTVVYIVNNAFYSLKYDDPGNPTKLTPDLIGRIRDFEISPDSRWLVYSLETDSLIPTEMNEQVFSVNLETTETPNPLGPAAIIKTTVPGGVDFQITFDSQRVVFTVSEPVSDPMFPGFEVAGLRLYKSPIEGGTATEITSGPRSAVVFALSNDSEFVVYTQTQEAGLFPPPFLDLFSSRLSAAGSIPLNAGGAAVFTRFDITDDSNRVLYVDVNPISGELTELRSVAIDGGDTNTLAAFATQVISVFMEGTADSQRAVYTVTDSSQGTQLYSSAVSGGDVDLLSEGLAANTIQFRLSSDSQHVIFNAVAGSDNDVRSALYSVPTSVVATAAPERIAGSLENSASALLMLGINITFDSSHVVYSTISPEDPLDEKPGATDVWSAEIDGTVSPVLLSSPTPPSAARIPYFALSADSQNLFFLADQTTLDQFELFAVPVAGGDIRTLNGPLPGEGDVPFAFWTINSGLVIYQADEAEAGLFDLWLYELPLFESGFEL